MKNMQHCGRTRELLIEHYQTYPKLQTEDVFKYIFQSAFGCEHLVSDEKTVLDRIKEEYASVSTANEPYKDQLDGEYSRVWLSCLNAGLKAETLAKLFCFSAVKEPNGVQMLKEKLDTATELVRCGDLPLNKDDFNTALCRWQENGYPAVHHSEVFRSEYRPAYRVIANRYADFLNVFAAIDRLLEKGDAVIAIEGGSASGKTTLASVIEKIYDCNVFHMDDFFLRPEQRTPQRFAETGGNIDKERFCEEIIDPLTKRKTVRYRRFDCSTQTLGEVITVAPKKLTVIEGAYSMHPNFARCYDFSVFLDIDPQLQRERILKRNTPQLAKRFFEEWIPLENAYFSQMQVKNRCTETVKIEKR